MESTTEELITLPDVGDVVAENIDSFFRDPVMVSSIERMLAAGVNPVAEEAPSWWLARITPSSAKPSSSHGTLSTMGRDECAKKLEARGAKITGSVSKRLTS